MTTRTERHTRGVLGLTTLGAAALMLWITAQGPGVNPDSTVYLDVAANVRVGRGVYEQGHAMTQHAPAYPLLLAAVGVATTDVPRGAAVVHAALFAVNALLFARMVFVATARNRVAAATAFLFFVSSRVVLLIHSYVWSEALFLSCAFGGLLLLNAHLTRSALEAHRRWRLLAASVLLAGAWAARYVGVALLPLLAAPLWLGPSRSRRDRLFDVCVASVVMVTPMMAWLLRNARVSGSATTRTLIWDPNVWTDLKTLIVSLHDSILDVHMPNALNAVDLALVAAGLMAGVWILLRRRARTDAPARTPDAAALPLLSLAAAAGYLAVVLLTVSLLDRSVPLDVRIVSPAVLIAAPGLFAIAHAALTALQSRALARTAAAALLIACAVNAASALPWIRDAHENGQGYTSTVWRESPTVAAVSAVGAEITIYSNDPWALRFLVRNDARLIPLSHVGRSGLPTPDYDAELRAMCDACVAGRAVLVWFPRTGPYPGVREHIESTCPLPRRDLPDGTIYGLPPDRARLDRERRDDAVIQWRRIRGMGAP